MSRKTKSKIAGASFVVTGGAGFIGSNLVIKLLNSGAKRVVVFDNLARGKISNLGKYLKHPRLQFILGDIVSLQPNTLFFSDIDYVFHEAAIRITHGQVDPKLNHDVIATGTFNVLNACINNNVKKVIVSSSASIYGDPTYLPMDESHPLNCESFYGSAKIYIEFLLRSFRHQNRLNFIALRPFNVYGPKMDISSPYQEIIPTWSSAIRANKPLVIHGNGKQRYDFTYVDDIVEANILALESPLNEGFFNVGTGKTTELNELANILIRLGGKVARTIHKDPGLRIRATSRQACVKKAQDELGFVAKVGLEDGLKKFLNWYSEQ